MKEIKKSKMREDAEIHTVMYTVAQVSNSSNYGQSLTSSPIQRNFELSNDEAKELLSNFFGNDLKFNLLKEVVTYSQSRETEFARKTGIFEFYALDIVEKELINHKKFLSPNNQTAEVPLLRWLDLSTTYEVCIYLSLDKAAKKFKLMVTYKKANSFSTKEYAFPLQPLSLMTDGSQIFSRFSLYSNQAISALELDAQP